MFVHQIVCAYAYAYAEKSLRFLREGGHSLAPAVQLRALGHWGLAPCVVQPQTLHSLTAPPFKRTLNRPPSPQSHPPPSHATPTTTPFRTACPAPDCGLQLRSAAFFEATLSAATLIHSEMVYCVLRAPLSFFHTNPTGRIVNRCGERLVRGYDWSEPSCCQDRAGALHACMPGRVRGHGHNNNMHDTCTCACSTTTHA